jgi:hypothetical protein
MKRLAIAFAGIAVASLALSVAPAAAATEFDCQPEVPSFGLCNFDVTFTGPSGETLTQAGAHPFAMTTSFEVSGEETDEEGVLLTEAIKDAIFTLMPGFVGSPTAVPTCSAADFLARIPNPLEIKKHGSAFFVSDCPDSAAVGVVANQISNKSVSLPVHSAVYNLENSPGKASKLGFWSGAIPITIDVELSEEAPNQVVAGPTDVPQLVEVVGSKFTLWGVPADERHDPLRGFCIDGTGESLGECHISITEAPFLTMPRACRGPLRSTYVARSWLGGESSGEALTHDEFGNSQGMSGCGALGFSPEVSATPTSRSAASPAGMDVSLKIDDEGLTNPHGIAGSDIEKASLVLPEGVTLNPSEAEGLKTCSKEEMERETASSAFGAGCPAESKVGSVEVQSPLLEGEILKGSLFLATPYENPLGKLIALYMTIKEPDRGVGITLVGKVEPDPSTGQLIATFGEGGPELPQAPISDLRVSLAEGTRSPLITPSRCGTYTAAMILTPTADPADPFTATSRFQIEHGAGGGPCPPAGPPPFEPGFSAGTLANGATVHSPFLMRLTRRDGDQDLTRFAATLPPGVLASLIGVQKCSDAQIAHARGRSGPHGGAEELADPSCKAASKVGTTEAGAGAGAQLTYVPGSLYLAGPYNGAPLSVVSITPGVAGPFDVGTVVVRVALDFDPRSGEVKADGSRSDPIPHILRGIPLAVRDLQVNVDRPNWIFNPTSCRESSTRATIFGSAANVFDPADDIGIARSARFQAADCAALPFGPKLALKLKGGTARGAHPALTATYTARKGDANLRNLSLLFPRSAFVENANFRTICTRKEFAADNCPQGSVYGHVTARTPLLEEPLSGPVYLRSSNHPLPDAVFALHGIIDVEVPVRIDSFKQRLRATVTNAPDAPVSKVVVKMQGARKGLFVNSRDLCAATNKAEVELTAQSAKKLKRDPVVEPGGCKKTAAHEQARTPLGARADPSRSRVTYPWCCL